MASEPDDLNFLMFCVPALKDGKGKVMGKGKVNMWMDT